MSTFYFFQVFLFLFNIQIFMSTNNIYQSFPDLPSNAVYFATYEAFQDLIKEKFPNMQMEVLSAIFSGGMSGIAYWVVGMPPDVLKSRLQTGALKDFCFSYISELL